MADSTRPVTAYPNPNPTGYSAHPPPTNPTALLHRVLALLIGLVVIFATITLIVWLVYRPQLPQFRVDSVTLSKLTVGNDSLLSVAAVARLTVRNPNRKVALSYDHAVAKFYYQSWWLSDTTIPPFSQETKNVTSLTVSFAAAARFLEAAAVDGVNGERRSNGNVVFNLRIVSRIGFTAKAWRARRRYLKVNCGDLVVGIPANGRPGILSGGPRRCEVGT